MAFKFVMITQEDPFYVRLFFEEFLAAYPRREEIGAVVIAPTMGKKSLGRLVRQMYDFYGPFDFVRMGVRFVVHKLLHRVARIVPLGRFFSIEQVCSHYGTPVWFTASVNSAEFIERLRALAPDLIVSVAAPQVFKSPLIAVPRNGCINIHNSKLPKYRGMLPNFWQMFNGEKTTGTTIHRINESLDDGALLAQSENEIIAGESLDSLICRTKRAGAQLMIDTIQQIKNGTIRDMPNAREEASYYTFPTREDVREFRRRGYRLV